MTTDFTDGRLPDRLLSTEALAEYLDIPIQTIYQWRTKGAGPRGIKVGRHIRFRQTDINTWLDALASR